MLYQIGKAILDSITADTVKADEKPIPNISASRIPQGMIASKVGPAAVLTFL